MNTKKILTFVAIAAGGYLAYKFLFKKKGTTSFVGNEDAYQVPFTGNENAYRNQPSGFADFSGTIAVNKRGANPMDVKRAVRANLSRRRTF
jgi:hypothetical protein